MQAHFWCTCVPIGHSGRTCIFREVRFVFHHKDCLRAIGCARQAMMHYDDERFSSNLIAPPCSSCYTVAAANQQSVTINRQSSSSLSIRMGGTCWLGGFLIQKRQSDAAYASGVGRWKRNVTKPITMLTLFHDPKPPYYHTQSGGGLGEVLNEPCGRRGCEGQNL